MTPERKAEIEAWEKDLRASTNTFRVDVADALRELLAEVDRADASGYARGRAEAVEECLSLCLAVEQKGGNALDCYREIRSLSQKDTRHAD